MHIHINMRITDKYYLQIRKSEVNYFISVFNSATREALGQTVSFKASGTIEVIENRAF